MKSYDIDREAELVASHFTRERNFWLTKLSGDLVKSTFPYDYERTGKHQRHMNPMVLKFPGFVAAKLIKASGASDSRLHMLLVTALVQLLNKYTGNPDIIVGIPIYKQEIEGEFVNTVLALKNRLESHMTFKDLLSQVRQSIIEANEHLNYPIETTAHELGMSYSENEDFPLFDTILLLENIHDKDYIRNIHTNMVFSFSRSGENLEGEVVYNSYLYRETTIKRIIESFVYLLGETLLHANSPIAGIPVLSAEEKKEVLFDFNNTGAQYPKEMTIRQLFEKQVEETPHGIAVLEGAQQFSYGQLNETANHIAAILIEKGVKINTIVGIMGKRSFRIVAGILAILKVGATYLPINAKDPDDRIRFILEDSKANVLITQRHLVESKGFLLGLESLQNTILLEELPGKSGVDLYCGGQGNPASFNKPGDYAYVIYTSGTTGKPKGVLVTHQNVVNYTWWAAGIYVRGERVNFPLYTSIAFDLTVTSIFTPLITGNAIVVYEGDGSEALIEKVVVDNRVGVVKLTPSHLRLIRDIRMQGKVSSIKRLILGGEALETQLAKEIHENFRGNIEIYNEYGPTEATVGSMIYKYDPQKERRKYVPIGKPSDNTQVYLLNRNMELLPIGAKGELYISGDGTAAGYLNRPELTAQKFTPRTSPDVTQTNFNKKFFRGSRGAIFQKSPPGCRRLYQTGDLARRLESGDIEFCGRIDNQVKIRGYRVESGEIEHQLLEHAEIKAAIVLPREDENGDNYLCAYIVADRKFPVSELREYLSGELPDYMIPSYFAALDDIPLTPNGKLDKQALPDPRLHVEVEYIAPRNDVERKLVKIWSEILNIEESLIGIGVNFFELGGHSLNATLLVSRIHKKFNVKMLLEDIFRAPTIREISEHLKGLAKDIFIAIEPVEEREYYDLSHSQRRLWVMSQEEEASLTFNISGALYLEGKLDERAFASAFSTLIARHESLRTVFITIHDEPKQKILPAGESGFHLEHLDLREIADIESKILQLARSEWNIGFDLSTGPLLRTKLARVNREKYVLIFTMHHIISDALSMDVVVKEVMTLYYHYEAGKECPLKPLKIQYKDYTAWHNEQLAGKEIENHKRYWLNQLHGQLPLLELPVDKERPKVMTYNGHSHAFHISEEVTERLKALGRQNDATLFMVLLAAFKVLISRVTGQDDIIIGIPISGREHADLEGQIGFYLNMLPLRTRLRTEMTFIDVLAKEKEISLGAYQHQVYPFDLVVDRLGIPRDVSRHPVFDVVVDMINYNFSEFNFENNLTENQLKLYPVETNSCKSKFDLTMYIYERKTSIDIDFEYYKDLFEEETIVHLAECFLVLLNSIIQDPIASIFDLPITEELTFSTITPLKR